MAGRIPQEFLDQLLARTDLVEVINARVPLRRAGRQFMACCPFHAEKTPSFSVSPQKQFYYCFGCGAHGTAISFLMDYERLDFLDAVADLARLAGLELPKTGTEPLRSTQPLRDSLAQADQWFRRQLREHPTRQRAVDYLRRRGLTGQIAAAFSIGYAPPGGDNLSLALLNTGIEARSLIDAGLAQRDEQGRLRDRFRDRIIFPIRDRRGQTIAFGGRVISDEAAPKYLNSPETLLFHKGSTLYGLYEARHRSGPLPRLLVVEGYLDVVALAQHGIAYAVATLGTATTAEHVERLFRTVNELVFCFDGDRAGRAAAWRALQTVLPLLRHGRQAGFLHLPDGDDPDTLVRREGQAAFEQRLAQAIPLADYLFAELRAQTNPDTLTGRARLADLAGPLLEKLPEGHLRDLMEERLQHEAKLPNTRLRPPAKAAQPVNRHLRLTRTPLRKAIALLLHRPPLAPQVLVSGMMPNDASQPGLQLLIELAAVLNANPGLNIAAVLERYRDTREGSILEQLAQWQPEAADEDYQFEAEFADILAYLRRRDDDPDQHLLELLLQRGTPGTLSAKERDALRNLGKSKKV